VIRPVVPVTKEVERVVVLPGLKKETEKERPRPERLMSRVGMERDKEVMGLETELEVTEKLQTWCPPTSAMIPRLARLEAVLCSLRKAKLVARVCSAPPAGLI
jgi:hypothetical protein